jgi:hypothetical protein
MIQLVWRLIIQLGAWGRGEGNRVPRKATDSSVRWGTSTLQAELPVAISCCQCAPVLSCSSWRSAWAFRSRLMQAGAIQQAAP